MPTSKHASSASLAIRTMDARPVWSLPSPPTVPTTRAKEPDTESSDGMTLKIGSALENGIERSVTRVALTFVAVTFVLDAVATLFASAAVSGAATPSSYANAPGMGGMGGPAGMAGGNPLNAPALPVGPVASAVVAAVVAVASAFVYLALYRAFVDDVERVTADLFTHRWLGAFAHLVALAIVAVVVFAVTALLNLVPVLGTIVWVVLVVFLVVAFYFAPLRIAAEDEGFVTALSETWALTSGNRLRLFALGAVYLLVAGLVSAVLQAVFGFVPYVGFLGTALVTAYFTVLNAAVTVAAYDQLLAEDEGDAAASDDAGGPDDGDGGDRTPRPTAVGR